MRRIDGIGVCLVGVAVVGLLRYRAIYVEPVSWGARCAPDAAPLACAPRAVLLWLQQKQLWGALALLVGVCAFFIEHVAMAVAAVLFGAMAVINYNATWGMLGLALGGWIWIMSVPTAGSSATTARQE
jgi:hypothetical protein